MTWLERFENQLKRIVGPADIGADRHDPQHLVTQREAGEHLAGGWVRRGTPGNYYVVRQEAVQGDS